MASEVNGYSDRSSNDAPAKDKVQSHYEEMIARYEKTFDPWHQAARKAYEIYSKPAKNGKRRMAMLWANINVLQPAIYARLPLPSVSRRFLDADPLANKASELIERCMAYEFDQRNVDSILRLVRDDFLITGRGSAWARYAADTKVQESEADDAELPTDVEQAEPQIEITDERVEYEFVTYSDFGHNVARNWGEVTDVWRRVYLTRDELKSRFADTLSPEEINSIPMDMKSKGDATQAPGKQAMVYEIWCKSTRKVYWIVKGFLKPLDRSDPPINLQGFFPCPAPIYTTCEPNSLIPVPDYRMYQDQAEEVDDLTARIAAMTDAVKMVGFYPAESDGSTNAAIEKAARPDVENKLIPIPNWGALMEKTGGNGITWWPAQDVARTIENLIGLRKALIDDIYQLTGISDIVRGQGQASETATQSNIKAQWGSMRIRDRQVALARFARDLARIGGEIIAEHFDPKTLNDMSNLNLPTKAMLMQAASMAKMAQQPPPSPDTITIDAVAELLRNDRLRSYRIDIETDQMVEADEQAEKASRIELMGAIGNMVQQAGPVLMSPMGKAMAPLLAEVAMYTLRGFKAGRQVEDSITKGFGGLMQELNQPPAPPQPDPVAQAKAQAAMIKADNDQQRLQADAVNKSDRLTLDVQKHNDQTQLKMRELDLEHDAQELEKMKVMFGG